MHLNTAVSALMELVNEIYAFGERIGIRPTGREDEPPARVARPEGASVLREAIEALLLTMAPFTPHLAEELWERLGHAGGLASASWPAFDAEAAREDEIEIPVQVNGKVRTRVVVARDASEDAIRSAALDAPALQSHLAGMEIVKVVVANGRLVSVVVKPQAGRQ
jgi:leucyl-tRNA synthetase